jgi:hypothetical protein
MYKVKIFYKDGTMEEFSSENGCIQDEEGLLYWNVTEQDFVYIPVHNIRKVEEKYYE